MPNLVQHTLFHSSQIRDAWGNASLTKDCRYQMLIYQSCNQGNAFVSLRSDPAWLHERLFHISRQVELRTSAALTAPAILRIFKRSPGSGQVTVKALVLPIFTVNLTSFAYSASIRIYCTWASVWLVLIYIDMKSVLWFDWSLDKKLTNALNRNQKTTC